MKTFTKNTAANAAHCGLLNHPLTKIAQIKSIYK
jgi:hypothetical protein